jgi:hypothetical protein
LPVPAREPGSDKSDAQTKNHQTEKRKQLFGGGIDAVERKFGDGRKSALAVQRLAIKEVDDGIWLVSFMLLKIWDISIWNRGLCKRSTILIEHELVTHVLGTNCYRWLRAGQTKNGAPETMKLGTAMSL